MPRRKDHKGKSKAPSKKIQLEETVKCGTDASYFINRYVKIMHSLEGEINFKTYPFQDECLEAFQNKRFVIVNKSRQLGLSTISAAYALWMALFQKGKNILVIATKLSTAKLFIQKAEAMLRSLPDWLVMPHMKAKASQYIVFSNDSQIKAIPTSQDAGRGEALSLLIIDEAAHVENIEDLWLGLRPTLSCLVGKTKVFTDKGIFNIEDLHKNREIGEYFEINNWKVFGKNGLEKLSHGYVSPESKTIKATTKNGYSVEGTLKHPLWILNENGGSMKQLQNVSIGDYVRVQIGMNCFGQSDYSNEILNSKIAYMLGGYIAEGNMVRGKNTKNEVVYNGIQITNYDDDFKEIYKNANEYGLLKNFCKKPSNPNKLFCYSTTVAKHFINLGINPIEKCHNKHTPKSIWTSKKEHMCSYLSGLFDGDGCVTTRGVLLNSTSKDLIEETQLLLSNLGFVTNIMHIPADKILERERRNSRLLPQGKPVQSLKDSWQIQIPRSQFAKFANLIGFKIKRKQNKLLKYSQKFIQNEAKLYNIPVPIIKDTLKKIITKFGKTDAWFRNHGIRMDKWKSKSRTQRTITQNWLKTFRKLIKNHGYIETPEEETFFDNILGKFIWTPVVSLEKGQQKTYDFTVPNTHTFIQNGILGSNTGGSAILISTPSGVGTLFHKIWKAAKDGEGEFHPIELPWHKHPDRDENWFNKEKEDIIKAKGERGVAQELLCSFMASGDTFLKPENLQAIYNNIKEPIATYGPADYVKKDVWIWAHPKTSHKYVLSADIARGDGDDFSAFHVIDTDDDEVVAEFKGKLPPDKFGELIAEVGFMYNSALVAPEKNSVGIAAIIKLKDMKYPNLYYDKLQKNMYANYNLSDTENETPGFDTNNKTRVEILAKLENVLRNQSLKIYSSRLYEELLTFVWKNNKPQAQKGYNDDLVISLAIGNSLFEAGGANNNSDDEFAKAVLAGMSVTKNTMEINTGKINSSQDNVPPIMTGGNMHDVMKQAKEKSVSNSNVQDYNDPYFRQFKWVLDD